MRLLVALLVAANAYLGVRHASTRDELTELELERDRLVAEAERLEEAAQGQARFGEGMRRLAASGISDPLDIATLRRVLLDVERGLGVDRLSLDFRPDDNAPAGYEGSQIHATLGGSFASLHEYLSRIEAMHLPFATEEMTLRPDSRAMLLTIRWTVRWPVSAGRRGEGDFASVESWLAREPAPPPGRNLFALEERTRPATTPGATSVSPPVADRASGEPGESIAPVPILTGFVLARPELEADVSRRVLAALRLEDGLALVKVGDEVEGFRVEAMKARESVVLVRLATGERLTLRLP